MSSVDSTSSLLKFGMSRSVPLILQTEVAECGLASLAMIACYHGHKLDMISMRKYYTASMNGMNLQQLIDVADDLSLAGRALQCPIEDVSRLQVPCILHWDMNHFVVLTKVVRRGVGYKFWVNDPALGKSSYSSEEFGKHFTGVALELTPTSEFESKVENTKMKLSQLWSSTSGVASSLLKLFGLSVVLQVFALISPYYMQWVVDEVLVSFDEALLLVLAIGFGFISIFSVITGAVRSWLVLRVSSLLNMQMGANLLRHLLQLPMGYFEARHVGDIVSRFGSLSQIRERITTGFVETLVDSVMSIAVLVMMALYSVELTMVVVLAIFLYVIVRLVLYRSLHKATEDLIQNSAKEQSNFLENIRGIQTIKLFGNESQRQGIWQNRYAEVINSEIRLGRLNISFESFNKLLFGLENIVVVYLASVMVIEGSLTVGMILAFIAYKNQLTVRFSNLVEQIIQFKMMRLHLDRIADIALTKKEMFRDGVSQKDSFSGGLVLEDVCFSYEEGDLLLNHINLKINPGDSVAITGPSGSGKTTLMKIMLGLLQPTSGKVYFDGVDINQIGLKSYRKRISAVMQDDVLLSGSIADNICFFDPQPSYPRIKECAQISAIHEDICAMTMGYNSLVGDMGAALSGGQRQRVLLARALYQSPNILFMDEATSHLDKRNEADISVKIQNLSITRVMIAHRQETINRASRVFNLEKGELIAVNS